MMLRLGENLAPRFHLDKYSHHKRKVTTSLGTKTATNYSSRCDAGFGTDQTNYNYYMAYLYMHMETESCKGKLISIEM